MARKKKQSSASKSLLRFRDRSKLSFFFVLFFFALFGIIILMETFIPEVKIIIEEESDDTNNFDEIEYEVEILNTMPTKGTLQPSRISTDWQRVIGTTNKFLVYSAYYLEEKGHIRVIGATKTKSQQRVKCRFYDNDTKAFATVDGTIKTIRENWNLKYSACFIICPVTLPSTASASDPTIPSFVSITATPTPSNIIRVHNPITQTDNYKFTACVKPLHFEYNKINDFIEWIEFYKLMGVEHFTFYNHTIGSEMNCLMRSYPNEIEILPWNLPIISQKEIRTEGLFAALNDCVYRYRGRSEYVVVVDLDEMVVPRKAQNFSSLMTQLAPLETRRQIGAWSIQNAFFYLQWPDEQHNSTLLMLKKTRRRARLHPHKQRSKYICRPSKILEAGNHFIWELAPSYFTQACPSHIVALHHYRVCEFGGDQCVKSPSVIDSSALIFSVPLISSFNNKLQQFNDICKS